MQCTNTPSTSRGWSIYTSTLAAGETPCFTSQPYALIGPSLAARAPASAASTSLITTQLFSLKYTLHPKSSLSRGAKAGIAIAVVVLGISLVLVALFVIRRHRARKAALRDPTAVLDRKSSLYRPPTRDQSMGVAELPSPTYTDARTEQPVYFASPPPIESEPVLAAPPLPPAELVGDTFMHEHHPAHNPEEPREGDAFQVPTPNSEGSRGSARDDQRFSGIVSPLDSPSPSRNIGSFP